MQVEKKLYTVEEFLDFLTQPENEQRHLELIDGAIVEVSPKLEHGLVTSVVHGEIYIYLKANPIGRVMEEVDHYLPDDPRNTRRPDVSFISSARLALLERGENVPLMPDLAVEVKCPSNAVRGETGLRQKAEYYLRNGSRLVWLFYAPSRTVDVCTLDADGNLLVTTLGVEETLDGGDVLPGFRLALKDV
jgi:Uma2 family endonuclease